MVLRMGVEANCFAGGTRVLRVLAVFHPVGTASTGTASTASTRGSTKVLPISAVYWEN